MTRFDRFASASLAAVLLFTAGCHKKEISTEARLEAANDFSDAQFGMNIKEYPRAMDGFKKAAELCPDNGDYWLYLGFASIRAGDKSSAKDAYEKAADAYKAAYKADNKALAAVQQAAFAYLLLHRSDDAKDLLTKVAKDHPENTALNAFVTSPQVDKMGDDPRVKDLGI